MNDRPLHHSRLVTGAKRLARLGHPVLPLIHVNGKLVPARKGWAATASHNPETVEELFDQCPSAAGVGVRTGRGFFVVDLDRGHGAGVDGVAAFAALVRANGPVPLGPRVRTPRGGLHLWLPPNNLLLFEGLINAARKAAPNASIAFNTRPDDSADAAARWLKVE